MRSNCLIFLVTLLLFPACLSTSKEHSANQSRVRIVGAMKNVMWNGQLKGSIDLDTLAHKQHLYGLGPVEYLRGELLIMDGNAYKSTVLPDGSMRVQETFKVKAPFFVFSTVAQWQEKHLPDSIQNIRQLEAFLEVETRTAKRPFAFKLSGMVEKAEIHIVNLPKGSEVSSPVQAHQGQVNYSLYDEKVEILGFFSTEHQTVFTHHDSYVHLHLLTTDKTKMGHLDELKFNPKMLKLYVPVEE